MYRLDAVGRLAPDTLDLSREAGVRHAHVAALRHAGDRPRNGSSRSGLRRLRLRVGRLLPLSPGVREPREVRRVRAT